MPDTDPDTLLMVRADMSLVASARASAMTMFTI